MYVHVFDVWLLWQTFVVVFFHVSTYVFVNEFNIEDDEQKNTNEKICKRIAFSIDSSVQ